MRIAGFVAILLGLMSPATAHEYWIEPLEYQIAPGPAIEARVFNGEDFEGVEYSYGPRGFERAGVRFNGQSAPIAGQSGQKPAFIVPARGIGLHVLHQTTSAQQLTYEEIAKFESFLKGKRLEAILEVHAEKGMPTENIVEAYFRFAKSLVAVGNGRGEDAAIGMAYELIALKNPYTDPGDIDFLLNLRGKPVANAPVFVFHKQGTSVEKIQLRTDDQGVVTVPRDTGSFMVNAVHIEEPDPRLVEAIGAHWQTLWASSTYAIAQ